MIKFDKEVLEKLKNEVMARESDIIIIKKGSTNKHLIIVSKNSLKWEIFNGSTQFPLNKAYEILGINDKDILSSTSINYSMFNL